MAGIKEFLTRDHRDCDESFALMEEAIASKSPESTSKFETFYTSMMHHFDMEEEVLFPSFETATGMSQGPTVVMRSEHEQMRRLMAQMTQAVVGKDEERFFGLSETLMMLMQQHNMKEEQMLYTMADQRLSSEADVIVEKMKNL